MKKFDLKSETGRHAFKKILKEELEPERKKEVLDSLTNEVANIMDKVLMSYGVERKGLSEQQAALLYRMLCKVLEDVLDDFTSTTISDPNIRKRAQELTRS